MMTQKGSFLFLSPPPAYPPGQLQEAGRLLLLALQMEAFQLAGGEVDK